MSNSPLSLLWTRLAKEGSEILLVTSPFLWPSNILCRDPGEILAEIMTQFPIYVELNSTSLQLSGPSWISNRRPMPRVLTLNTRLGLLDMILSSPLKMVMEMMLQNICWSPPRISVGCSSMFFLLISKAWAWKWRCILPFFFIAKSNRLLNRSGV